MQSLESLGITQLYRTGVDRRGELKRLLHSVLAAFLDLLEILVRCTGPSGGVQLFDNFSCNFSFASHPSLTFHTTASVRSLSSDNASSRTFDCFSLTSII
jgi:hypothetical protein